MAKIKVNAWVSAHFSISPDGTIREPSFTVCAYKPTDTYSSQYEYITLRVGGEAPIEIEIETPDSFDAQLLAALSKEKDNIRVEHAKTLTKLRFLENQLLKLDAPDVLDAEPKGRDDRVIFVGGDDGLPF